MNTVRLGHGNTGKDWNCSLKGFVADIEELTEENRDFRRVLYTGKHLQLVLMSLLPGEEIGEEVHEDRDQFFRIEKGKGEVWIDGNRSKIKSDDAIAGRRAAQNCQHRREALSALHSLCAAGTSRRHGLRCKGGG